YDVTVIGLRLIEEIKYPDEWLIMEELADPSVLAGKNIGNAFATVNCRCSGDVDERHRIPEPRGVHLIGECFVQIFIGCDLCLGNAGKAKNYVLPGTAGFAITVVSVQFVSHRSYISIFRSCSI